MISRDERDFYEDHHENKQCIGYCTYCKNEIFLGQTKVVEDGLFYHKDCYLLENQEKEPGIFDE